MAKYQQGANKNAPSGTIYLRAKPRYKANEAFKAVLKKLLLAEPLRWNDVLKLYTTKVYTITQSDKILNGMRLLEGGDEDLPETIDESVFEGARSTDIQIIETVIQDNEE